VERDARSDGSATHDHDVGPFHCLGTLGA
jgi:hypothetical protein